MGYGKLPFTGAAITVGGLAFASWQVAAIAAAMIGIGAVIVRLTFRRGRKASQP